MSDTINWGILGTGNMAKIMARELTSFAGARLAAIGSRTPEAAASFAGEFGIKGAHGSYEDLAADKDVEIVYVATPHFRHIEDVRLCLEAGKHVLCERPFALKPDNVVPLVNLARDKNLFLMEGMWTRFIPCMRKVQEVVAQGVIGDVTMLVAGGGFIPSDKTAPHIYDPDHGGGAILDSGIDLIALASLVFGRPTTVNAIAALSEEGVDEQSGILLGYGHGKIANLYVTIKATQPPYLTLLGTQGLIEVTPPVYAPHAFTVQNNKGERTSYDVPYEGSGYAYQIEEVVRCLRSGKTESAVMPLEETLQILDVTNEIRLQIGLRFPYE